MGRCLVLKTNLDFILDMLMDNSVVLENSFKISALSKHTDVEAEVSSFGLNQLSPQNSFTRMPWKDESPVLHR